MPPRTRSALARFLDRIRGSYPGGIPHIALRASAAQGVACSLVVVTDQPALPDGERALVEAICSKGLRLPLERCRVSLVSPRTELLAALGTLREGQEGAHAVTIVFGADGELGVLGQGPGGPVLQTHALGRIGSDQSAKRETWSHLQTLLPLLPVGTA